MSVYIYNVARMGQNFEYYPGLQLFTGMPIHLQQCSAYITYVLF